MKKPPSRTLVLGVLLLVQVLFGIGYLTSKMIVERWPALVWAGFRMDISAAMMFAIAWSSRKPCPEISRKFLGTILLASIFGIVINQACFLIGLKYTSVTNSAVLNSLIPVFTAIFVGIRGQERFSPGRLFGLTLSLIGVLILCKIEQFQILDRSWIGDLLTVGNGLSFAIFLAFLKPFFSQHDPLWTTAWTFLAGGLLLTAASIPEWRTFHLASIDGPLAAAMLFAIIGTTLLTYFLSIWALGHASSTHVALFVYVQPAVTAVLAWAVLGNAITVRTVFSASLIFAGLYFAISRASTRIKSAGTVEFAGTKYPLLDISRDGFALLAPACTDHIAGTVIPVKVLVQGMGFDAYARVVSITPSEGKRRLGCQYRNLSQEAAAALSRIIS